jgi:hypothetical protein
MKMLNEEVPGLYESYRANVGKEMTVTWDGLDSQLKIVLVGKSVSTIIRLDRECASALTTAINNALESQRVEE